MEKKGKRPKPGKDRRRKHRHWLVTVYYHDGEKFARVYIDRAKAAKFAERQKNSPVVKYARPAGRLGGDHFLPNVKLLSRQEAAAVVFLLAAGTSLSVLRARAIRKYVERP